MENSNSLYDRNGEGDNPLDDPNIKKVRFKELEISPEDVMVVDSTPTPTLSWKDLVLGKSSLELNEVSGDHFVDGGFSLIEGDVKKSVANGIPFIDFSEREHQLLVKEMSTSVVLKFPGLPSYLYKNEVLWEIRGMVSKVTKLDFNIDSKVRVRYASMTVYVNLGKPLISKVLINGNLQRVEYESLLVVCFFCGRYGHNNESCPHTSLPSGLSKSIKDLIGMNSSNPTGEDCVSLDNVAKAHQPSISGGMDPTEEDRMSLDIVAKAYQPFVLGKHVPLSSSSIVLADFYKGGVDMALSKSNQFKKEQSLHFNPTFEEATMVDVVVNEGILDANNHTAVIFKDNTQHNFSRKMVGSSSTTSRNQLPLSKIKESKVKTLSSKGGWKINRI
ncbi:hypothetical protein Goklo_029724 [Gossypium klotzschianum]|uniref:CCHC-type domain-containing protein n=1 Tax=Gossypium klotzschianum TaxID=34286 RepID=A0A7J8WCD6_9ROSI|nr:hypothetical protein [Gossypium klotzschianum]